MGSMENIPSEKRNKGMKVFKVKITESLSRIVEIEAGSSTEAVAKVNSLYKNAVITLDSSDYTEVHITEASDSEEADKVSGNKQPSLN
ncbi:hypothetical protein SDC9_66723 [bioreactor metagenome]|uniref:DpnD/PcfM-like C-terminal domain-containing protein n=1 Tax=bioreactor metagenome TaxID=1076179 RepID=A0A644Y2C2_9ZZZZ